MQIKEGFSSYFMIISKFRNWQVQQCSSCLKPNSSWHFQNPKPRFLILDPSLVTISRNEKLLIITPYSLRNVIHREAANEFLEDYMLWFYSLMKPYYMMIDKLTFFIGHSSEKKDHAWWNGEVFFFLNS